MLLSVRKKNVLSVSVELSFGLLSKFLFQESLHLHVLVPTSTATLILLDALLKSFAILSYCVHI